MHLRDLTALPVGLMLFFSILFRPVLAAPPVLPFAVVGVDHDAGLSRVAVARHAVGTTETRTARAAPCMRTVLSRFRSPETEKISVVPSGSAVIGDRRRLSLDINGEINANNGAVQPAIR